MNTAGAEDDMIGRETREMTDAEQSVADDLLSEPFGKKQPNLMQSGLIGLARRSVLHRGKLRHLMTRLVTALGGPVDVTRFGCNYRIEGVNNLIEYGLLLHPDYNREEIDFLIEGISDDGVAVDIGSNIGLYSLPMAKSAARVISIDANPAMAERLSFNARASELNNVDIIHAAVGDSDGMATLHIHRDDLAIVNILEDSAGTVPMQTLERILADLDVTSVDVLKIDVEGHEDKALAPYLNSVTEALIPDRIVIERVGPDDYPACFAAFEALGYRATGRTRSNSLYQRGV